MGAGIDMVGGYMKLSTTGVIVGAIRAYRCDSIAHMLLTPTYNWFSVTSREKGVHAARTRRRRRSKFARP